MKLAVVMLITHVHIPGFDITSRMVLVLKSVKLESDKTKGENKLVAKNDLFMRSLVFYK